MVDAVAKPQPFTTIKYTTKDGETISATKNDGIVTLVGDKNGTRQMPLEEFKKELLATLPTNALEKTPQKDTVEIAKTAEKAPAQIAPEPPKAEAKTSDEPAKKLDVAA